MALPERAPSILMGFLRMLFPKQVCYQGNKLCCHPKMWGTPKGHTDSSTGTNENSLISLKFPHRGIPLFHHLPDVKVKHLGAQALGFR